MDVRNKAIAASVALMFVSQPGWSAVLEEITVTAQKREENIQDVGIAISAFDGSQIDQLGWDNAEDVAAQTPGLIATSYNGANTISLFSIRGIAQTDFNDHQEAPSIVYMDGAYIPFTSSAGAAVYDMERIEVLRGPQGTLYGRNATGGLIHLITARPTEEFEGYGEITGARFGTINFEGAVSGPLGDNVQGRLSVLTQHTDSYFKNRIGPDIRGIESYNIRAQLQSQLTDKLFGHVVFNYGDADYGNAAYAHRVASLNADGLGVFGGAPTDFGGYVDDDGDLYTGDFGTPGPNNANSWGVTGTLEYEINDSVMLTLITNYQESEKFYQEDSDSSPAQFGDFLTDQDASSFAQEVRLNGSTEKLDWTAGFYYINIDGDYRVSFNFPDYFGYSIFPNNLYSMETDSWAVFGQLEYQLTDQIRLIGGLRYTEDEKEFDTNVVCEDFGMAPTDNGCDDFGLVQGGVQPFETVTDLSPLTLDREDTDFTGKLQIDWTPTDDILVYAGFSRGMKAGGFLGSIDGGATLGELQFEPEILHTYEAGVKLTFLDGRARFNASGFYYDYEDYQAFVFQGITSVIQNQDANITGGEFELIATPAEGLDILIGLSLMDAEVEDVQISPGVVRDQDMVLAPDVTFNFLGRKAWQTEHGEFALQLDGIYVSEQQFNTINSEAAANESYDLWNARVSYKPNENWEAEFFVNNLTDEEYWTYGFDLALFFGSAIQAVGEPRWFGGSVRYSF